MTKKNIILAILFILTIAPIIGLLVPWLHAFIPIAIAFDVPLDAPPCAESVLPLVGMLSLLTGAVGLIIYFISKGRRITGLKVFCYFHFTYSGLALLIWFIFFGSRFIRFFPIKEPVFYIMFFEAIIPHIIWLSILFWSLHTLKKNLLSITHT